VTLAPSALSRPPINPWLVAVAVVIPTFMEVKRSVAEKGERIGAE
jgi:hypothetical protein